MTFNDISQNHNINSNNNSLIAFQPNHMPQILFLLLLGVLASLGAPPPGVDVGGLKCIIRDLEYNVDQAWFRHIRTSSETHCVRCLCKSDGFATSINCSNVTCTPDMCTGQSKNECCAVCQGPTETVTNSNLVNPFTGNQRMPCLHGGRIYHDGDEFASNATGLQAQKPNQCVHCVCQAGLVLCRLRTCGPITCPTEDVKNCCPTCNDEEASEEVSQTNPVLVTIMVSDGQSTSGDCAAAGVTYSHGSTWHPVIGPFGPMDCVFCKCQYGKIECSRLECLPLHKLPCLKPLQVPGHCCPQCTGEDSSSSMVSGSSIQPVLHQPSISVTMEQKGVHPINENNSPKPGVMQFCLPSQTNTLLFKSHAASSSSAYYQYAFQSAVGDLSTKLLTWTVKEGRIGDYSEQHLSREEFQILTGSFKFKLQGATRTKFMDKFIRKAKKLPDHCGTRCTTKIQRLEQVLHLRDTPKRLACLSQETPFH